MKHSITTFQVLLAISVGILDISISVAEIGYLMGKKPEYRWNHERFKGFENTDLIKRLYSLNKQGLIEKIENKYYLTKRGRVKFLELDILFNKDLPKNIPWKGFWYLVSFDIPQKCKSEREKLRRILIQSGFIKIQQSLYAYPHDIESNLSKIRSLFPRRHLLLIKTNSSDVTKLVYHVFNKNNIIN